MAERFVGKGFATKVDRYLRKEDTTLARAVNGTCSLRGTEYRNSRFKKGFELVITTPVAIMSIPATAMLGVAAKLESGGSMFFVHERIGQGGKPVGLVKIRTMKSGSDNPESNLANTPNHEPEDDPRNTKLGQKIRAYEIDEFPQFLQILKGDISLIDIRCIAQYAIDYIKENRPTTFEEWNKAYLAGKPGLLNLNWAINKHKKDDLKRHHYDMLYARKASLGLDLFIIYRTSLRMFRKVEEKIKKMVQI